MNYRHIYHAGNFADVIKHLALVLCLDYLKTKDKPMAVIDAHGGCGLYDLQAVEAQKTLEYAKGIAPVMDLTAAPPDLDLYRREVKKSWGRGKYPGSPLLIARSLRTDDRAVVNELHPVDIETLRSNMAGYANVMVTQRDAYEIIRAQLPPVERRGLVLVDPPFEKKDEFKTLCQQMREWQKRWAAGTFILWYPIKAHLPSADLHRAARDLGWPKTWVWEYLIHPRNQPETFNGCGLLFLGAPYRIPERLQALEPILAQAMGGKFESQWLTAD